MKNNIRCQLTLFVNKADAGPIEEIRRRYDPLQQKLIDAHVTLCREDELESRDRILENLEHLQQQPISIFFDELVRFENGAGVLIPCADRNDAFLQLRKKILAGVFDYPRKHQPHITLMHPRNATCTDAIFEAIKKERLPKKLVFNTITLIEQKDGGPWRILRTFVLSD